MEKQLDFFKPEEKKMSTRELADALGVSIELVTKRTRELFPGKMKTGVKTVFDESEATILKLRIQENSNLSTSYDRTRLSEMPKTELEKKLLIKQGYDLLMEEVVNLQNENKQLKIEKFENAPKVEFYDKVTESESELDMSAVCKVLNIEGFGRTKLMKFLRDRKILRNNNQPYQEYIKYFRSAEINTNIGVKLKPVINQRGLEFLIKILKKDGII